MMIVLLGVSDPEHAPQLPSEARPDGSDGPHRTADRFRFLDPANFQIVDRRGHGGDARAEIAAESHRLPPALGLASTRCSPNAPLRRLGDPVRLDEIAGFGRHRIYQIQHHIN